ncbi:uncharacterized protein LOC141719448 [Apium graveolens]|uniref:uncharacterized protein LOC141719448 n=1 Tax=Apium graveolens TaxID=4045 RepID=UPI003D7B1071
MDMKSIFLNGELNDEVYVEQPTGFIDPKYLIHVYKLDKTLYGLKQAPRAWYETLAQFLLESGFKREEDEGELINDDGFVYKRNKRPRLDITAATSAPPPDPLVEDNNRKIRRRNALLKLKEKYQAELSRWELLSNTLRDLNLQTQNVEKRSEKIDVGQRGDELSFEFLGCSGCAIVDELLAQLLNGPGEMVCRLDANLNNCSTTFSTAASSFGFSSVVTSDVVSGSVVFTSSALGASSAGAETSTRGSSFFSSLPLISCFIYAKMKSTDWYCKELSLGHVLLDGLCRILSWDLSFEGQILSLFGVNEDEDE